MNPRLARTLIALAALVSGASLLGSACIARSCGLDWKLPRNHFEGVTNQGTVSFWEKIGEVDCGEGLVLPLHINFSSLRDGGAPSSYLGQGWMLALLESKFVQEGEDRFNMIQPDGLNNLFLRAEKGSSVLNGSAGWKGEIAGDTINAWASCGWKLTFNNGRIASMTTAKGRRLDWVYGGGKVSELREGGTTRLKVEYGTDGKMQALALPGTGERIVVAQDSKPRVQTVAGQNVITGIDKSLSHLVLTDGREQSFSFNADERVQPTLEVGELGGGENQKAATTSTATRQVVWDPQSKLAVREGEWTYQITPAKGAGENAAIGRTNAQKQKEYWFYDVSAGKETTKLADGIIKIVYRFVAGPSHDKIRRIEQVKDGNLVEIYKASYDAVGRLQREITDKSTVNYTYNPDGSPKSAYANNSPIWIRTVDNIHKTLTITSFIGEKNTVTSIIPLP